MSEMDKIDPRPEAVDKTADDTPTEIVGGEETHGESTPNAKEEKQPVYLNEDWVLSPSQVDKFFNPFSHDLTNHTLKATPITVPMAHYTPAELDAVDEEFEQRIHKEHSDENVKNALLNNFRSYKQDMAMGTWYNGTYDDFFTREGSEFTQRVDSEKGPLGIATQSLTTSGANLTGPSALMALQNVMGQGKPTRVPLWSSGIAVTLAGFKESEILTLSMALTEARAEIGYESGGLLFSAGDTNAVSDIVDFVLSHVIATTIRGWTKGDIETLKAHILVTDIPALLTGALVTIYPSGYPALHTCKMAGSEICDYEPQIKQDTIGAEYSVDSLIDFKRTLWVDTSRINKAMRTHMSAKDNTHTLEQIRQYQETNTPVEGITKEINGVRLILSVPTIAKYTDYGRRWINNVLNMTNEVMDNVRTGTAAERKKKRQGVIRQYQRVLRVQRYAAWVSSIQFGNFDDMDSDPTTIDEENSLFSALETLASDDEISKHLIDAVGNYKKASQNSFNGIPNYKCPSCGTPQVEPSETKHSLIPINMVSYFFIIMVWRWAREGTTLIRES